MGTYVIMTLPSHPTVRPLVLSYLAMLLALPGIIRGQTTVTYDLTAEEIFVADFPAFQGGYYPSDGYGNVDEPLLAEPFASDAGFFNTAADVITIAGSEGPVFFGGNANGNLNNGGIFATPVSTTTTYSTDDFPLRLSGRFFLRTNAPIANEYYLALIPAEHEAYGTIVYNVESFNDPGEGVRVGGTPGQNLIQDMRGFDEPITTLLNNSHSSSQPNEWIDVEVSFELDGNDLIVSSYRENGDCLLNQTSVNLGPQDWLDNFRVGFAIDDLASSFRVDTQVGELSAAFEVASTLCVDECINPELLSSTSFVECDDDGPEYNWSFPGGTPSSFTGPDPGAICYAEAGTYTVSLTATAGNLTETSSQSITVSTLPSFSLGPDTTICANQTVTLAADTPANSYAWSTGATTNSIDVTDAGDYALTVTDSNGCTAADTVNVAHIAGTEALNIGPDTLICFGESATLQANITASSYLWSTGDTTATITVDQAGSYVLTATSAECDVPLTDTIHISWFDAPGSLTIESDTLLCRGANLTLSASGSTDVFTWSTGENGASISVDTAGTFAVTASFAACGTELTDSVAIAYVFGPTGVDLGADTTICQGEPVMLSTSIMADAYQWSTGDATPAITVYEAGSYVLTARIDDCTSTDTLVIAYPAGAGSIDLGPDREVCDGDDVLLDAQLPTATAYRWSTGDTTSSIRVLEAGGYSVTVSSDSVCEALIDSVRLLTQPSSFFWMPETTLTICVGDSTRIEVPDFADTEVQWSDGDSTRTYLIDGAGFYQLRLTNDCADTTYRFQVREEICCVLAYPNAFSPNRDGLNDRFRPYFLPEDCQALAAYRFEVWTRWGEHVYRTTDLTTGWDGAMRGRRANPGVYAWLATYAVGDEVIVQSGSVTLLR